MNAWIIIFALIGMLAVGILFGCLLAPILLYILDRLAYMLAWILSSTAITRKVTRYIIKNFSQNPVQDTNDGKPKVYPPQPIHSSRHLIVNKGIFSRIPDIKEFQKSDTTSPNQDALNVVIQTVTNKPNKVSNILHNLKEFYMRFYGMSTKSKQNLLKVNNELKQKPNLLTRRRE